MIGSEAFEHGLGESAFNLSAEETRKTTESYMIGCCGKGGCPESGVCPGECMSAADVSDRPVISTSAGLKPCGRHEIHAAAPSAEGACEPDPSRSSASTEAAVTTSTRTASTRPSRW